MFGHTIVAVDESGGGRDAIALAQRLIVWDGKLTLAMSSPPLRGRSFGRVRQANPLSGARSVEEGER